MIKHIDLNDKQMECYRYLLDNTTSYILFGGDGNSGKSYLSCLWLIVNCLQYKKSRWCLCRSTLKGIKTKLLKTFIRCCNDHGIKKDVHYKINLQNSTIYFYDIESKKFEGSEIELVNLEYKPSDPDADFLGGGEYCGGVVDELPEVSKQYYETLFSRCRYKLDEFNIIPKLLGTCNPSNSWVKSHFYDRWKDNTLPSNTRFINTVGAVNKFRGKIYDEQVKNYSERQYKRIVLGDWDYASSIDQLFNSDKIEEIFSPIDFYKREGDNIINDYYLTIDVARFGKDSTVICLWNNLTIDKVIKLEKYDTVATSNEILKLMNQYKVPTNKVIVDADGVGGGVVDMVRAKGFHNAGKALNGEKYNNIKAQCYYRLAKEKWSISSKVDSIHKDQIKKELNAIRDESSDSVYMINDKESQKKILGCSPDYTDSIMLRMYFLYRKGNVMLDFV